TAGSPALGDPERQVAGEIHVPEEWYEAEQQGVDEETQGDDQRDGRPVRPQEVGQRLRGLRRFEVERAADHRLKREQAAHEHIDADKENQDADGGPQRAGHHLFRPLSLNGIAEQDNETMRIATWLNRLLAIQIN